MRGKVKLMTADTHILLMVYHAFTKAMLLGAIGTTQS